ALLSGNLQIHELIRARTAIIPEANFFNLEVMLPAPLFFQAGLLTVESVNKSSGYSKCRLGYPNPKVEASVC
ncbi:MAG: hypothetical protein LBE49_08835, partial [Deltaproteobacteria bacterium]|nr:hypothetical protein [Deltaproteobacteria bacterium]